MSRPHGWDSGQPRLIIREWFQAGFQSDYTDFLKSFSYPLEAVFSGWWSDEQWRARSPATGLLLGNIDMRPTHIHCICFFWCLASVYNAFLQLQWSIDGSPDPLIIIFQNHSNHCKHLVHWVIMGNGMYIYLCISLILCVQRSTLIIVYPTGWGPQSIAFKTIWFLVDITWHNNYSIHGVC